MASTATTTYASFVSNVERTEISDARPPPSRLPARVEIRTDSTRWITPTVNQTTKNPPLCLVCSPAKANAVPTQSSKTNEGSIQLILGPMFSGKTTEMLRRLRRYTVTGRSSIVFKYAADVRYASGSTLATYSGIACDATGVTTVEEIETELAKSTKPFDLVCIDEGQFFPGVKELCERLANEGTIVIVTALSGDYKRHVFPEILELFGVADEKAVLCSICLRCGKDAPFTFRSALSEELKVIGGEKEYEALCRRCYFVRDEEKKEIVAEIAEYERFGRVSSSESLVDERAFRFEEMKAKHKILDDAFAKNGFVSCVSQTG